MGSKTNRQLLGTHRSLSFKFVNVFMHRRMSIHGYYEKYTVKKNYDVVTLPFTPSIGWFCIEAVAK